VSVRGLLELGSVASKKLPDFEENNVEFKEPHPPSESQRAKRPSRTLRSADHRVQETLPPVLYCNGPSTWFCIRSVTYRHTINVQVIVKEKISVDHK
jgi:hypothetical protein